jgi:7-carboxy-7-deazaguanine synthase
LGYLSHRLLRRLEEEPVVLLIREIYPAILGESRHSGETCAIVRLTGCHRRCVYCDTAYAFQGGEAMTSDDVLARVREIGFATVLVTGGEPLLQKECRDLLAGLLADGLRVVLETSGTLGVRVPLAEVPAGVCRVVDIKTPGSGIAETQIDWAGIAALGGDDEIKLVICGRPDYEWARQLVRQERLPGGVPVTFSPSYGAVVPRDLAEWILADRLPVRFQIQLHKVVWPEAEGGV